MIRNWLVSLLVIMAVLLVSMPVSADIHAPRIKVKEGTSSNWSGYAVETNLDTPQSNAVTYVTGTWTVPAVTSTANNAYSSIWVGIDGYDSNTVEQIGTDGFWINGEAVYSAWYEMYPKFPVTIPITLTPGDTITASVSYVAKGTFSLALTNLTTKETFTTKQKCPSADRSSAEWIVEAPWSGGVLPLANFGSTTFTGCSATINNHQGPINDTSWQYDAIDMVNYSTDAVKADTGDLSKKGTGFTVTWISNN